MKPRAQLFVKKVFEINNVELFAVGVCRINFSTPGFLLPSLFLHKTKFYAFARKFMLCYLNILKFYESTITLMKFPTSEREERKPV